MPNKTAEKQQAPLIGSELEASSLYKSPYFPDSYFFPYNPDPLARGNNYKIYDDMKNDDQVKVAVSFKKDMVINTGWNFVCDNPQVKDFMTDALQDLESTNDFDASFEDSLRDMCSSFDYGFSMTEPVYKLAGGLYNLASLKTRPPHGFLFDIDNRGNIVKIVQQTNEGALTFEPRTFMHHVYQTEFGNPYGKSDLRAAHDPWKAKAFVNKFLAIYLERFATPVVVGKYPGTFEDDEITKLLDTLKRIQQVTSMVIPDGAMVEFVQANKDSSETYIKALHFYNMVIARAILVPDLMGISGEQTSGGSYSLGTNHFKLFLSTIKKDRESLQRKINLRLVRPMVQANFGAVDCKFEFLPFTSDDEIEYSKLWVEAVKGKVFTPNNDEINHLRAQLKFPEGPVEIPEPAPSPFDPANPLAADADTEPKAEPPKPKQFKLSREPNVYEKKVDFQVVADVLEKGEARAQRELAAATKKAFDSYIDQIRESGLVRNFRPQRLNELEPKFLREMNVLLKTYLVGMFESAYAEARREIFPNGTKTYAAEDELIPEEMVQILEADAFSIVGDYKNLFTKKVKATLLELMKEGAGEGKMFQVLRDVYPATTDNWLRTMIRTKTTEVYNRGRKSYYDNDPLARQVIEAYEFSAILDDRTSEVCASLDGKIFLAGEFTNQIVPPLHYNCRSVLVPVTKFEDYTPAREPSLDSLVEKGGNLVIASADGEVRKMQSRARNMEQAPILVNALRLRSFGDSVLVSSAGPGTFLHVLLLKASKAEMVGPVIVGFRENPFEAVRYAQMLPKAGATLEQDFREAHWILPENTPLLANLSSYTPVDFTAEYIITNASGRRIL